MTNTEKLVIKTINKPSGGDEEGLLEWFCEVFDLNGSGDIEPYLLKEIAGGSMKGEGVTSIELTEKLNIPRSTVIYHLNRFIYSGIVIRKGRKYYLRSNDMESTMEELQSEILHEFNRLIEFAQQLDQLIEEDVHDRRQKRRK